MELRELSNDSIKEGWDALYKQDIRGISDEALLFLDFISWYFDWWGDTRQLEDDSPYWLLPCKKVNESVFDDFLAVVRHYGRRKLKLTNEKVFVKFILRCDEESKDMYIKFVSNDVEVRKLIRKLRPAIPKSIRADQVFRDSSPVLDPVTGLTFPAAITVVPDQEYISCVLIRKRGGTRVIVPGEKVKFIDKIYITEAEFVIVGQYGKTNKMIYPLDFFETVDDYRAYIKFGTVPSLDKRLKSLEQFIARYYTRQIYRGKVHYITAADNFENVVRDVLTEHDQTRLMVCSEDHKLSTLDTVVVKGITEGLWIDERGIARGVYVWHNSVKLRCGIDFSIPDNAKLLLLPKLLHKRVCTFRLLRYSGALAAGVIRDIHWEQKPYKMDYHRFVNGEKGFVEKCAYCARADVKEKYYGCCENTHCNWQSLFGRWGPDVWIKPKPRLVQRRKETGWSHEMLNNMGWHYRGYRIIAREDGYLMFATDAEMAARYETTRTWAQRQYNQAEIIYDSWEALYQRYQNKYIEGYYKAKERKIGSGNAENTGRAFQELYLYTASEEIDGSDY